MPVFVEDGITLTLGNGQTVTLIERPQSVADRKLAQKRAMSVGHDLNIKQKRVEAMTDKLTELEGKTTAEIEASPESAQLFNEVGDITASAFIEDLQTVYAEGLARRFESWDFYATKADFEAGKPVPLTKEAILEQFQYSSRAALLMEIVNLLSEYDKRLERKNVESPVNSGGQSRMEVQTVQ